MTKWKELADKFQALASSTGASKSSSFELNITFTLFGGIYVELGGYDIGDWYRHEGLGPFETEEQALAATEAKIEEAYRIVTEETKEEP